MNTRLAAISRLDALLDNIPYAMLTTTAEDGRLVSRPMTMQRTAFYGEFWFITDRRVHSAAIIEKNTEVNISLMSINNRFISISGRAQVKDDPNRCQELWDKSHLTWFPGGMEDPNLTLLQVTVDQADYWDAPKTRTGRMLHFTNTIVLGNGAVTGPREHIEFADVTKSSDARP